MADVINAPDTITREDDDTHPEAAVRNNIVGTLSQGRIVTFVRWFIYVSSLHTTDHYWSGTGSHLGSSL